MIKDIPIHLQDILETKPSSYEKLNLVFHELSIQDQIFIVKFKKESTDEIAYLRDEFLLNAIKSKNAYIRYLVSESLNFYSDDSITRQEIKQLIEKDKNDFVRNSLLETDWIFPYNKFEKYFEINNFLKLSQSERLACVRKVTSSFEHIATLFKGLADSLKKEKIDELSVFEILSEFSKNKDLYKEMWRSGSYEINDVLKTANLFPDNISYVLIKNLPVHNIFDDDLLKSLSEKDLEELMEREEFTNKEFRQNYFYKKLSNYNNQLASGEENSEERSLRLCSSTLHSFSLTEEIINELLKLKNKAQEPIEGLIDYSGISLGEVEILKHLAETLNIKFKWFSIGETKRQQKLEEKIIESLNKNLETFEIERIVNEVLGYLTAILCGRLLNKNIPETDSLYSYNKYVVEGDIWKTYQEIMGTFNLLPISNRARICETLSYFNNINKFDEFLTKFT